MDDLKDKNNDIANMDSAELRGFEKLFMSKYSSELET